ncbi:MAG: Gfo/Idh/MocA family oxidoreductase [Caldilineaceae bacterium]|nr:Gfo/Idh/MocA family oxidoreductase [Caldilineaceae bacterium]
MKVGILGAGFMGGTHARGYAKLDGVTIAAISSRTLAKAQALTDEVGGTPTTDEWAILHDPTIDAVSITLPTPLHKPMTLAALAAGKHVLLEKPFALTVADCDEMIARWQQQDKILMVGQTLRFWPEYKAVVAFVQSGALGKPLAATASRLSQRPAWSSWFTDPAQSGGAVLDLMIHDLDALNWLLGPPKTVYCRGQQSAPGMWDHMLATVDYGSAAGVIEASEMLPKDYPFSMSLIVLCEEGRVEYLFKAGGVSVEMGGGIDSVTVYEAGKNYPLPVPDRGDDAWAAEVAYFVDCVRHQRPPTIGSPTQARLAVAVANAARASLENGQVISLAG